MRIQSENDWLFCHDPDEMLRYLRQKKRAPSARKVRLFAVACCRCFGPLLDERSRRGLEVAERHADGQATTEELATAHTPMLERNWPRRGRLSRDPIVNAEVGAARVLASYVWTSVEGATRPGRPDSSRVIFAARILITRTPEFDPVVQASLCRDLFGNPFRSASLDPAWQTQSALLLAQTIYEEHAFDRLPILADALEDAGCSNADMLEHCRGDGKHARGCWVVDWILGKE